MLQWRNHDHMVGTLVATGARGEYSVQKVGPEWFLTACGHDGLSLLQVPVGGKPFPQLVSAQTFANELDRRPVLETQVGGE